MEWEIEYYKHVSMALRGGRLFSVRKASLGSLKMPAGDLMIFDGLRAIVNSYDQKGMVVAADFYERNDDLNEFIKLRETIMKLAEPLAP
jgi:hypothetical protein